jgi:hypothetical protein
LWGKHLSSPPSLLLLTSSDTARFMAEPPVPLTAPYSSIRVIAFEAQVRYAGHDTWLTLRVTRHWSEIERALGAVHNGDRLGRPGVGTRVVTVDHSESV